MGLEEVVDGLEVFVVWLNNTSFCFVFKYTSSTPSLVNAFSTRVKCLKVPINKLNMVGIRCESIVDVHVSTAELEVRGKSRTLVEFEGIRGQRGDESGS